MKRLIAFLLALLMLAAACAFAEEPAAEPVSSSAASAVSGSWFGKLNGFAVSLILNEDGTYLFRVAGLPEADSAGSWARVNGAVLLDGNEDLPFYFTDGKLFFAAMSMYMTREEEKAYEPDELLSAAESDLTLFQGAWVSRYVLMDGATVPAETLSDDTVIYVEGSMAALTGNLFGEIIADFAYADGAMTLSTRAMTVKLEMQQDLLLRMTVSSEGADLTYVLSPYRTEMLTSSIQGEEAEYEEDGKVRSFISRCYENALGRTISQSELNTWILSVGEGTMTPVQIASFVLSSDEYKGRQLSNEETVTALYRIYFDHDPDPDGLAYWTDQLNGGATLESIEEIFAASDEFKTAIE